MSIGAARWRAASAITFVVVIGFYGATEPLSPAWPTDTLVTPIGLHVGEALTAVPIGDPLQRPAALGIALTGAAAALMVLLLARRSVTPAVAVASTLAVVFGDSIARRTTAHPAGPLATVLVVCAIWIVAEAKWLARWRLAGALGLTACAAALDPVSLLAAPIVAAIGWKPHANWVVAASAAISIIGLVIATGAPHAVDGLIRLVRHDWRLAGTLVLAAGALASIWRGRLDAPALVGTAVIVAVAATGRDASALMVFPALLLANAVTAIARSNRVRGVILAGLVAVAAVDRMNAPTPDTWRLTAWRDAVQRALPEGGWIATTRPAIAALNGPLFSHDRHLRIQLAAADRPNGLPAVVLDDVRRAAAEAGRTLQPVRLAFASPADVLSRVPAGTIVALVASGLAAAEAPATVADAWRTLGRPPVTAPAVAVTVIGAGDAQSTEPGRYLHVLLGEQIDGTNHRAPVEFALSAAEGWAEIHVRGREVAAGAAWALVLIHPHGPVIGAFASDEPAGAFRLRLPGLRLWRLG